MWSTWFISSPCRHLPVVLPIVFRHETFTQVSHCCLWRHHAFQWTFPTLQRPKCKIENYRFTYGGHVSEQMAVYASTTPKIGQVNRYPQYRISPATKNSGSESRPQKVTRRVHNIVTLASVDILPSESGMHSIRNDSCSVGGKPFLCTLLHIFTTEKLWPSMMAIKLKLQGDCTLLGIRAARRRKEVNWRKLCHLCTGDGDRNGCACCHQRTGTASIRISTDVFDKQIWLQSRNFLSLLTEHLFNIFLKKRLHGIKISLSLPPTKNYHENPSVGRARTENLACPRFRFLCFPFSKTISHFPVVAFVRDVRVGRSVASFH